MLLEFENMTEMQMHRMVQEIYAEACLENAKYNHPNLEDLTEAILDEENYFVGFLKKFFEKEENIYYILEDNGRWVSALRLSKLDDFYYMESLETAPEYRKNGYAAVLIKSVEDLLQSRGYCEIRSNVNKSNVASLAVHKKCGFQVAENEGRNYLTGTTRDNVYGMLYIGENR